MEPGIAVAIIAAFASIGGAALSFYFSMRKEREADWRKVKFEHYREFMAALAAIVGSDSTPEGHFRFAQSSNTVQLVASRQVITALHAFRDENSLSNVSRSQDRVDALLSSLIREMRADLGMSVESNPADLSVRLWVSGNDRADPMRSE
jgi:hypothetical protein